MPSGHLFITGLRFADCTRILSTKPCEMKRIDSNYRIRPNVATLPCYIKSPLPFTVCATDPNQHVLAALGRNTISTPHLNRKTLQRFRSFVRLNLRRLVGPLDKYLTFEEWLDQSNYTTSRKEQLRKARVFCHEHLDEIKQRTRESLDRGFVVKKLDWFAGVESHIKREWYVSKKLPRRINSRTDYYKSLFGPICASFERHIFKNSKISPFFIKSIPDDLRCKYITSKLDLNAKHFVSTDFSTFEATISAEIMRACEFQVYHHLRKSAAHPEFDTEFIGDLIHLQALDTWATGGSTRVKAAAYRMSGEMNTSLGNGLTNLFTYAFALQEAGCPDPFSSQFGVFEGDDGLSAVNILPKIEIFSELGLVMKLETHSELSHASFCGKIFDVVDNAVVGDPLYYLSTCGWSFKAVACTDDVSNKLMAAKGLSFCYQFNGCPILYELGHYLFRNSKQTLESVRKFVERSHIDVYEKTLLLRSMVQAPRRTITARTRAVCCEVFNVPVPVQLYVEDLLSTSYGSLDMMFLRNLYPPDWTWQSDKLSVEYVHVHKYSDSLEGDIDPVNVISAPLVKQ